MCYIIIIIIYFIERFSRHPKSLYRVSCLYREFSLVLDIWFKVLETHREHVSEPWTTVRSGVLPGGLWTDPDRWFPHRYSVAVRDFGKSWTSGLAFLAVIKSIDPSLVDMRKALLRTAKENLEDGFRIAHFSLGIPRLLEPEGNEINIYRLLIPRTRRLTRDI